MAAAVVTGVVATKEMTGVTMMTEDPVVSEILMNLMVEGAKVVDMVADMAVEVSIMAVVEEDHMVAEDDLAIMELQQQLQSLHQQQLQLRQLMQLFQHR